jgi:methionyl-tRNA synthetase
VNTAVYHTAEALRIAGILLQPYMPGKAAELLDRLAVGKENRRFEDARLGADFEYGKNIKSAKTVWDGLFPVLPVID